MRTAILLCLALMLALPTVAGEGQAMPVEAFIQRTHIQADDRLRGEIETFLQNHDQSHVLTVLAEGEPAEVIPEILLKARDGTGKALEPLSCDYRGNRRAARKTEIPRLAAALLGCSYDELVMRERQYRRKRFAIAGSAAGILAAAAISYLIWSNTQIRKNYNLAQENYRRAEENYQLAEENRIRIPPQQISR